MSDLDKLRQNAIRLAALAESQSAAIDRLILNVERMQDRYVAELDKIIRLRAAGDALCRYVIESGPGLHDDEAVIAYWQEVSGGEA